MPMVYVGRDTRMSSPLLSNAVIAGIRALGVDYKDFGEVTTPQLHYLVAKHQENPTPADYIDNFTNAFKEFCAISGA